MKSSWKAYQQGWSGHPGHPPQRSFRLDMVTQPCLLTRFVQKNSELSGVDFIASSEQKAEV